MTAWNIDLALPAAQKRFAFELFRALYSDNTDDNVVCSPLSIWCALILPWLGASGRTVAAFDAALHLDGLDRERIHTGLKSYLAHMMSPTDGAKVEVANSIWANTDRNRQEIAFRPDFVELVRQIMSAEIMARDFAEAGTVTEMNRWVQQKTNGRIGDLIAPPISGQESILINAASFEGKWRKPFKREATVPDKFHCANGQTVNVPMMRQNGTMKYGESDRFQACILPYGTESNFALYLLLPRKNVPLSAKTLDEAYENSLDPFGTEMGNRKGTIFLPRFTGRQRADISARLATLGIGIAFDAAQADFSPMIDEHKRPFWIQNVLHEAIVEIDEEGTRAAAATGMRYAGAAKPPPEPEPFVMRLDRPFIYAVTDQWPQSVLFMGVLNDLTAN